MLKYKFGKLPAKKDPRILKFSNFFKIPAIPAAIDWTVKCKNPWNMLKNDLIGDCTVAGAAHNVMLWTANVSKETFISDEEVVTEYSAVSGYDPETGDNDNGCYLVDVLDRWKEQGLFEHKIVNYFQVDPQNKDEIMASMYLGGGLCIGIELPMSAADFKEMWDVVPGDKIVGGHCVILVAATQDELTCITWGAEQKFTWEFLQTYCDEAFAMISPDWFDSKGINPAGFNSKQLSEDLKRMG
jgi:hypothetical protein